MIWAPGDNWRGLRHDGAAASPYRLVRGDPLRFFDAIGEALAGADLFVAIGTSGSVYPAAGLVREARMMGLRTCELNLEPSDNADVFDERAYGPASEVVPDFVARVLAELPVRFDQNFENQKSSASKISSNDLSAMKSGLTEAALYLELLFLSSHHLLSNEKHAQVFRKRPPDGTLRILPI